MSQEDLPDALTTDVLDRGITVVTFFRNGVGISYVTTLPAAPALFVAPGQKGQALSIETVLFPDPIDPAVPLARQAAHAEIVRKVRTGAALR
jgi:hypothetical protein